MRGAELSHAGADHGARVGDHGRRHAGLIEIVPAGLAHLREHLDSVVNDLRPEDAATVAAMGGDPHGVYSALLARSTMAWAATVDGEPAALWGAALDNFMAPDHAHLWLVIRGDAPRPVHFIGRHARPFVERAQACYGRLVTTVAWGYGRDHRLMRWLGFRRVPAQDKKTGGRMFLAYER